MQHAADCCYINWLTLILLEMPAERLYFCDCLKYCKFHKQVSKTSYYKHKNHQLADLPDTYHSGPFNPSQTNIHECHTVISSDVRAGPSTKEISQPPLAKQPRQDSITSSSHSSHGVSSCNSTTKQTFWFPFTLKMIAYILIIPLMTLYLTLMDLLCLMHLLSNRLEI